MKYTREQLDNAITTILPHLKDQTVWNASGGRTTALRMAIIEVFTYQEKYPSQRSDGILRAAKKDLDKDGMFNFEEEKHASD